MHMKMITNKAAGQQFLTFQMKNVLTSTRIKFYWVHHIVPSPELQPIFFHRWQTVIEMEREDELEFKYRSYWRSNKSGTYLINS